MDLKHIMKIAGQKIVFALVVLLMSVVSEVNVNAATGPIKVKVSNKPVEPFYSANSRTEGEVVYQPTISYLSPLKKAPITFTSLNATWEQNAPEGTSVEVAVRFMQSNGLTDWYVLDGELENKLMRNLGSDSEPEDLPVGKSKPYAFISTNASTALQYRIILKTSNVNETPEFQNLNLTYITSGDLNVTQQLAVQTRKVKRETVFVDHHEDIPDEIDSDAILGTGKLVAAAEKPLVNPTLKINKPVVKKPLPKIPTATSNLQVISRSEWGADESLRLYNEETNTDPVLVKLDPDFYDKYADELKERLRINTDDLGRTLTWPLSYPEKVSKIIVHHTATTKHLDDPARAIRDIYYWHSVKKGWGDIGYNYIIDQQGNIYEGRFGGEGVIGAHAGPGNTGSIGIALLGEYEQTSPPESAITSLTNLIREKAKLYQIDTEGNSLFRGKNYPNIMGHRDIMSTACPGQKVYDLLPLVRKMAKVDFSNSTVNNSGFNFGFKSTPLLNSLQTNAKKKILLTLENTGKTTWPKGTYFQVENNDAARALLKNPQKILSSALASEVKPGGAAKIEILLNSTSKSGNGLIQIFPVVAGKKANTYLSFPLAVNEPAPKAKYDYQLTALNYQPQNYQPGQTITATIKLKNTGISPWQKTGENKLTLGADKPRDHQSVLLSKPSNRLANLNENLVMSGQSATFTVSLTVPKEPGIYRTYFTPVVEGVAWMANRDTYLELKVGNSTQVKVTGVDLGVNRAEKPVSTTTPSGGSNINIASKPLDVSKSPRNIRVDLSYRGNPVTISGSGKFALEEGRKRLATFNADEKVQVQYLNGQFQVRHAEREWTVSSRPRFVPLVGTIMRIDNWERRNTWGDKANNNEFRGVLEVLLYNNELHVINELPLEDYLKGIAEESSNAPIDKIKTIMVIARTYARFYLEVAEKFPGAPFDLNDDPNYSQKYLGYSFEKRSPVTAKVAAETAGEYVTYQGKLIKTPYFSKSDGKKTISAKEKWGWTDAPWLVSVDDTVCQSTAFWGHGVGLSGCGATALAKQGKDYQQIIKYYYPGVEITKTK